MAIVRSSRRIGPARLEALARGLLDASDLCAIATSSPGGRPHINTAYFAYSASFDIVWLSDPSATHSRNVRARRSTAIAVYDSSQVWWGESDCGIQLFGTAQEVGERAAAEAAGVYSSRFATAEHDFREYRFYRFRPARLKVFHESELGGGVFVTARVRAGRLTWERTEIHRAN